MLNIALYLTRNMIKKRYKALNTNSASALVFGCRYYKRVVNQETGARTSN